MEGPSASAAAPSAMDDILDRPASLVSLSDFPWVDFDANPIKAETRDRDGTAGDTPPVPIINLRRRHAISLLRAASLPSSYTQSTTTPVGPRITERDWQEIGDHLKYLYDSRSGEEYYAPSSAGIISLDIEQQSASGITRSQTVRVAGSRMALDDDDEPYLPEVKVQRRKRDRLRSIGASLASKFKKLSRA